MSVIQNNLLMTPEGYQISRSVRLRRSASAYFNRTFGTPTNANIWTLSGWAKRGLLGTQISLFGSNVSTAYTSISFLSGDTLRINLANGTNAQLVTTQVFRDPSAFYHIAIAYDSTQATASNRIKLYVNGAQVTAFSTANYPSLNVSAEWNYSGAAGTIGTAATEYWEGYLTEVNFIDGQALTPASFGETDAVTGVWKPKKYAGTYGTNGFYLNFSDNSAATATAIGKDMSGNANNWTPNNISVTAGVTYDSMLDVPTLWADGGNGRGNYCTLNPLAVTVVTGSFSNGNLQGVTGTTGSGQFGTFEIPSTGKWYWEVAETVGGGALNVGIAAYQSNINNIYNNTNSALYSTSGVKNVNNVTDQAYGASWGVGDIIGVACDADAGTITFYKNNTSQGAISHIIGGLFPAFGDGTPGGQTSTFVVNFGQRPFAYTPPTGFKALNTQNLPDVTIKKGNQYFDVNTWSGTGATQSITNGGFQPDLVWVKSRSNVAYHNIVDAVRGLGNTLYSNATDAETFIANQVTTLNSNGFTLGADANGGTNYSGRTYVGWQWKESVTAGFDIVTYTGTGVNRTVAHSLGVAPAMLIVKKRSAVGQWIVQMSSFASGNNYLYLNGTAALGSESTLWNSTKATSASFSVGTNSDTNANGATYVAYLFSEVAGFSKFGSYTGNGSADGPFVFTGFKPRWIMIKASSTTENWAIIDTARDTVNASGFVLAPNLSDAELDWRASFPIDITANGFKVRSTGTRTNSNGATYIYAAFAENPFKNSLAR